MNLTKKMVIPMARTSATNPGADLPKLREMVMEKMVERGGGLFPEQMSDAASAIGTTGASLWTLMKGGGGCSAEMCVKLSVYLGKPPYEVLRLAGHAAVADILEVAAKVEARNAAKQQAGEKRQRVKK